jgi:MFS family permease
LSQRLEARYACLMLTHIHNLINRNRFTRTANASGHRCFDQDDGWVAGLCLARIGFTLIFNTYAATQPLLMRDWHMTAGQAGWIHSGFYIGYLISLFGVGVLADRYGAKRVALLASLAASGSAFLFAIFAHDLVSGFVFYGACALFFGGSYTPVLTVMAQRIETRRRGRAIGWYIAAGGLGYALSLYLSGVMMTHHGWRSAFYVTACGPTLGTVLLFLVLRHTPNVVPPRPQGAAEDNLWRAVLTDRGAVLIILGYTFHSWELLGMRAWIPTFLTASVALSTGDATRAAGLGASFGAILSVASMAGNITGGTLSDRWGRTAVIILMGAFSLACSFSIGWLVALPFWLVVLVGLLYSITSIGDSPVYSTALTELVPSRFLGTAYASRSVLGFGTGVISPLVFGLVLDWVKGSTGPTGALAWGLAFSSLGLGGLLGPLSTLWLRRLPESARMAGGRR